MAHIEIEGRLGKNPEQIEAKQSTFTSLTLAENKDYFDKATNEWIKREPNWFEFKCFGNLSTPAMNLKKGDRIQIKGNIEQVKKTMGEKTTYQYSLQARSIRKVEALGTSNKLENGVMFDSDEEIQF